jgi:hypothetical protein
VLFLAAMAASLTGGAIVSSTLAASSDLTAAAHLHADLSLGAALELLNALAVVGIAVLIYPLLKGYGQSAALGYLCLRAIEALFCTAAAAVPLSIVELGRRYAGVSSANVAQFAVPVALAIAQRAPCTDLLIRQFYGLGAVLFYILLYRSNVVPRAISVYGLIAAALVLIANSLPAFGMALPNTLLMALVLPMIANEILLGIWLIGHGFSR